MGWVKANNQRRCISAGNWTYYETVCKLFIMNLSSMQHSPQTEQLNIRMHKFSFIFVDLWIHS